MLTTLFALAVAPLLSPQGRPALTGEGAKLFRTVIEAPTGNNGYEDYVEAAALLATDEHKAFVAWQSYWQASHRGQDPVYDGKSRENPLPEPPRPPGLTLSATPLEVRTAYVKRFGLALEVMKRGNRKRVYQPRAKMDFETLFPELVHFKSLARLARDKALADFAAGNSAAGTEALLETLAFSYNMADGSMIHALVSSANHAIALAAFDPVIPCLSLPDAQLIIRKTNELLQRPPTARRVFESEFAFIGAGLDKLVQEPGRQYFSGEDLTSRLEALSGDERRKLVETVRGMLAQRHQDVAAKLAGPESGWHRLQFTDAPVSSAEAQTLNGLAATLVNELTPVFSQYLTVDARRRTQARILRLIGRVVAYRWTFDKLPEKLSDAAPAAEIQDPVNGREFKYEVTGKGAFRVYGEGFAETGPIDLVYKAPPGSPLRERDDNEPPDEK